MELSVVILNYNASVFLELCVESVVRATKNIDAEIIVADNDSTDHSLERVSKRYKEIRIVKLDKNYGFSKGNNIAVAQASGKFICLINPDIILSGSVFDKSLAFAKANSNTGFLGIQLLDGRGRFLPESKRRIPKPFSAIQKLLGFSANYYDQRISEDSNGPTEVLVGAFMLGKKHIYESLGGLDERYFMYGEDIDLSFTAIKNGYENVYLGACKAIHFKGESTIKDKLYRERFFEAMFLFYDKHYPTGKVLSKIMRYVLPRISRKKSAMLEKPSENRPIKLITEDLSYKPDWTAQTQSFDQLMNDFENDYQIIWDTSTLELERIVDFMQENVRRRFTYRFLNIDRSAFAGSDSSSERGETRFFP